MKLILEGKVLAFEEKKDPANPQILGVIVFGVERAITSTISGTEYIKAKTLVKPSKVGEVLRFEVEVFNIPSGSGKFISVNTIYRILKEVK